MRKDVEGKYRAEGTFEGFHKNGKKKSELTYKDGELEGLVTRWYENGQKESEVTYRGGKQEGLQTLWDENGKKKREGIFKGGKWVGLTDWYPSGQKRAQSALKDGKLDGLTTLWDERGNKTEVIYKEGKPVLGAEATSLAATAKPVELTREGLASFVGARRGRIGACYQRELVRNPSLAGRVVARFTITTKGLAGEVGIEEDTMGNDAVGECIKSVIRGWVFPFKPSEDTPVAYPFVFSPAK